MTKKTWSAPDGFTSGLLLLGLSILFGVCGFSLKREIARLDSDRAAIIADVRAGGSIAAAQNERLIRAEESFRFISSELARIAENLEKTNQKLDRLLTQNR